MGFVTDFDVHTKYNGSNQIDFDIETEIVQNFKMVGDSSILLKEGSYDDLSIDVEISFDDITFSAIGPRSDVYELVLSLQNQKF